MSTLFSAIDLEVLQPDRLPGCFFEMDLVKSNRALEVEDDAAGILADGLGFLSGQLDVALDDFHRRLRDRSLFFVFQRLDNRLVDVIGDFRRGASNQLDQRLLQ